MKAENKIQSIRLRFENECPLRYSHGLKRMVETLNYTEWLEQEVIRLESPRKECNHDIPNLNYKVSQCSKCGQLIQAETNEDERI